MSQLIAMLAMIIDHANLFGTQGYLLGRLAMPIYTYRQVGYQDWTLLGWVAIAAEIPFHLMTGMWINIVWLYVGMAMLRDGARRVAAPPASLGGAEWVLGLGGSLILGICVLHHPAWSIWIPLLCTRDRAFWYGMLIGCAIAWGWVWAVHLVGYEIARWKGPGKVWPTLWRVFYPVHMWGVVLARVV